MIRFQPARLALMLAILALPAHGEVRTETVRYQDGDTALVGHLAWDDAIEGPRPGVIVAHEWWGLNDYAKRRADMLAELGYVAFAVDMYGAGKVTEHAKEAGGWAKQISENVDAWRRRAMLGLDLLKADPHVDPERTAAVGYCFGGATVMQMAYAGADLDGVASFHGSLPVATPEQAQAVKASVFIAHGDADAFVPAERIVAFKQALTDAGVDWYMVSYGGVRHGFTNPDAGRYAIPNVQYDPAADRRSWAEMQRFLEDVFGQQ
jgi:dienelactone hydrolase